MSIDLVNVDVDKDTTLEQLYEKIDKAMGYKIPGRFELYYDVDSMLLYVHFEDGNENLGEILKLSGTYFKSWVIAYVYDTTVRI